MCNSAEELELRVKVKEKCRAKGFANGLHCKLLDLDTYQKIVSATKNSTTQARLKCPSHIKEILFWILEHKVSLRNLEQFLETNFVTITKST
jgi:hypothetical protein